MMIAMRQLSRLLFVLLCVAVSTGSVVAQRGQRASRPAAARHLTVYKNATCGCCAKWIDYMKAHGFTATVTDMPDVAPIKEKNGVPSSLKSCHTALIGNYVIEGHVPVEDVQKMLREKPAIAGLAAPGMPAGSPGMDVPNSPPFDVMSFDKAGNSSVYARHK
jgi:hypothetical protein